MNLSSIHQKLGYELKTPELLRQALTHRSRGMPNNERLEFLGDSLLNCAIAIKLYQLYPHLAEGDLSRIRAYLVKEPTLSEIALSLDLGNFLILGEGELKSGGFRRPSILADCLEAIFGAIYLDSGFDQAFKVIEKLYAPLLDTLDPKMLDKDPKTLLQEYLQGRKMALPQYVLQATLGEAHNQRFQVECVVAELDVRSLGEGHSRRSAEQNAAQNAFEMIKPHE